MNKCWPLVCINFRISQHFWRSTCFSVNPTIPHTSLLFSPIEGMVQKTSLLTFSSCIQLRLRITLLYFPFLNLWCVFPSLPSFSLAVWCLFPKQYHATYHRTGFQVFSSPVCTNRRVDYALAYAWSFTWGMHLWLSRGVAWLLASSLKLTKLEWIFVFGGSGLR